MTQWDERFRRNDEVIAEQDRLVYAINGLSWPHIERLDDRIAAAVASESPAS